GASGTTVANWVTQNLVGVANERGLDLEEIEIDAGEIAAIIRLVEDGSISATAGKQVLDEVVATGKPAEQIVDDKGLRQVSDTSQLEAWADEAIAENPGPVEQFRSGKDGAINALVGQVMKKSRGSANPQVVQQILRQRLSGS
ncbi:MAG: Asp-tRNA(Asn)/Glu-tRNA(Gln) amidotransferase subunit GatB, partial [Actinomycetota bacterium]